MENIQKTRKNRISKKQRMECFRSALGPLLAAQSTYEANMKQGVKPSKNNGN